MTYFDDGIETFKMPAPDFALREEPETWMEDRLRQTLHEDYGWSDEDLSAATSESPQSPLSPEDRDLIMQDAREAACDLAGWYWWACFPGCLPDGEAAGPFKSERAARRDSRV